MLKRGQLSFFIIIAIVLAGIVVLVSVVSDNSPLSLGGDGADVPKAAIRTCLESVIEDHLLLFLAEGGALSIRFEEDTIHIPVRTYYDSGKRNIPSIESLEEDFSQVVSNVIPFCLEQSYPGYEISFSEPLVGVDFLDKSAQIKVEQKIWIKTAQSTDSISELLFSYPISVPKYLSTAESIVDLIETDPSSIDLAGLSELSQSVSVETMTREFFIYTLPDMYSSSEKPLIFRFGALYETEQSNNAPFFINLEDSYSVNKNTRFEVDVNAVDPDGDTVFYSLDASEKTASINKFTGLLTYTGAELGAHPLTLHVDDGKGSLESREVMINVI